MSSSKQSRGDKSWIDDIFAELVGAAKTPSDDEPVGESQSWPVLDIIASPGSLNAKVQEQPGRLLRLNLSVEQLTDEQWTEVFKSLAHRSLYLSKLLANELPVELDQVFRAAGGNLIPSSEEQLQFSCECKKPLATCPHVARLLTRFIDSIEQNPFILFTLRGRGKDETLLELGRLRAKLRDEHRATSSLSTVTLPPIREERMSVTSFYSVPEELFHLSYNIRADEIPSAILRQLDPIPLGFSDDRVETMLDDAYAQVARRAQVFGLGFKPTSSRKG